MPRASTRPQAIPSPEHPGPRRETLRLGWAPTRRIAPVVAPSAGPREAEAAGPRPAATAAAKSPKSPPPLKGQTGPRPGY